MFDTILFNLSESNLKLKVYVLFEEVVSNDYSLDSSLYFLSSLFSLEIDIFYFMKVSNQVAISSNFSVAYLLALTNLSYFFLLSSFKAVTSNLILSPS